MRRPGHGIVMSSLLLALAVMAVPSAGAPSTRDRDRFDLRLFTRIGKPGSPEPVAIGADGRVYVGTNAGGTEAPSKIFAYSRRGRLLRTYVIRGQNLEEGHGIQGIAFDARGRLFALDRAADPRVIVIDPKTGSQRTYARFRDVPPCHLAGRSTNCSDTVGDDVGGPDYAAFGPNGALYVTDISQALIWRLPRGGGRPGIWLTDPRFDSVLGFGPNGIQFVDGGHTLRLAVTITAPSPGDPPVSGALFDIPLIGPHRSPGKLELFWRSHTADGLDGFAVGRSGTVYLMASVANQIVIISRRGEEKRRIPSTPGENASMEVPFDGPASAAFLGRRVLITNQSPFAGYSSSWAVLDLYAGERGLPLFRPMIRPSR